MATYPGAVKTFRTVEDVAGVSYDPENTTTIFAKDVADLFAEVNALEATLGINPQATSGTVAARLTAIEEDLGTATGGENATVLSRLANIETVLGTNPEGEEENIAARLTAIEAQLGGGGGPSIEDLQEQVNDLAEFCYGYLEPWLDETYSWVDDHESRIQDLESMI